MDLVFSFIVNTDSYCFNAASPKRTNRFLTFRFLVGMWTSLKLKNNKRRNQQIHGNLSMRQPNEGAFERFGKKRAWTCENPWIECGLCGCVRRKTVKDCGMSTRNASFSSWSCLIRTFWCVFSLFAHSNLLRILWFVISLTIFWQTKVPESSDGLGDAKGPGLVGPLNSSSETEGLKLNISFEHTGFQFEKNPEKAIEEIQYHSGGKVSEALRRAFRALESSAEDD